MGEDTKDIEIEESITFDQFKAWMVGLIEGKRGALPDIHDWKRIKQMMDKVKPEEKIIVAPQGIRTEDFWAQPYYVPQSPSDGDPNWGMPTITCNNTTTTDWTLTTTSHSGPITTDTVRITVDEKPF